MRQHEPVSLKIYNLHELLSRVDSWKKEGLSIVFTNGCFDLLHAGHVAYLSEAASLGDKLVLGLNSDISVKKIKGTDRPINDEKTRSLILASMSFIDAVILFHEETPLELIRQIKPDILVKGGDYEESGVVGGDFVKNNGGKVIILPFLEGYSSTNMIKRIKNIIDL